ncbi:hypothetical protein QFX18_05240 [Saccharophagus degradans]|uniref:hypothetical protein n=1 Tax=Saccharophagus degradans TaxID=86304 RepID=UPI002477D695|nr:hypothetical protein [Saccharophagus degradans]WGO99465.1 hypothetical protein QFX18_05240 [Saccharophagus degradans]
MHMELSGFELEIIKAIGKHQPAILDVIGELKVEKREFTGPGLYVDFMRVKGTVNHHVQILDLFGEIKLPSGLVLSAHIGMSGGKPEFLEVCTLPLTNWDGNYEGFVIKN